MSPPSRDKGSWVDTPSASGRGDGRDSTNPRGGGEVESFDIVPCVFLCLSICSTSISASKAEEQGVVTPLFRSPEAPSAELGPDQFDTDSLPPYSLLDKILMGIIEEKKDLQVLEKEGHTKEQILKIITLMKKEESKRRQAPPIQK